MKLRFVFPSAVAAILAICIYSDTAAYRVALKEPVRSEQAVELASQVEADVQRLAACKSLREQRGDGPPVLTESVRTCMIDGMGKTESAAGAIAFSTITSFWLADHASDGEIRTAALAAIEKGRAALAKQYAYYRALDRVTEAHDKSVVLSLLDGKQHKPSRFVSLADQLDRAEYAVMLPEVAQSQRVWRKNSDAG